MAVELKVPEVGESISEVQVGDWLKQEGESVRRDEVVVMIETDKVTVELPAPVDGVLSRITIKKGQTARVGDVVGFMEEKTAGASKSVKPQASTMQAASARPASEPPRSSPSSARVMPAAARILNEAGLSASSVSPSGPGGRLLKEDVERHVARPPVASAGASAAPSASTAGREEEIVAMTPMRRRIAERLVEAQKNAALLTTFNEVDMGEWKALRERYQPSFQEKYGIKLGLSSFFVKASIDALKQFPSVNAEIRGSDIVYKNYFDIGIAVGGGKGLVVPVIRDADRLSFAEVEQRTADFAARAKNNTLKLDELQGGTFTITNGGVYGSLLSTPIINPPQSGILGLHGIFDRPVARDGQVVIRPMMYIALTYDHRLVDGREAVSFLRRIKEAIEKPTRMLLEV